jgi:hypothetical protein
MTMITFLDLSPVRNRQSAIANRQFLLRHFTRADAAVLGFAAGCAFTVIVVVFVNLFTK